MAKDAHVPLRIEAEKLKKLQQIAKREDRSVSWLIRKAIDVLLKKEMA